MAPPGARAKISSDDRGVTRRAAVARELATAPPAGIDPASPTPLYHQIFSLLRGKIYDGQYPGGSFLPSEQELSAELSGEGQRLFRLKSPWATYIGFEPAIAGLEYVGVRLIGMVQLKGHRAVGGMRASIYNAMPIEGVQALVAYMKDFERRHG
jgi:hypothetical protein